MGLCSVITRREMIYKALSVTLTLEGPILTKSSTPGRYGADALMAINSNGKYYIPGTLVKGKLRDALNDLRDATGGTFFSCPDELLGGLSENKLGTTTVDPDRSQLRISDFVHEGSPEIKVLNRIRIDETRQAVVSGAIQMVDSPFGAGEKVCFRGTMAFNVAFEEDGKDIVEKISAGLRWITSLGSNRTIGFGKLINVSMIDVSMIDVSMIEELPKESAKAISTVKESITMVISPTSPFCIAKRRVAKNLFESDIVIPGGLIRGVIASDWGRLKNRGQNIDIDEGFDSERPELSKYFNSIRFRHAFPTTNILNCRPIVPPLSLVKSGDKDDKKYYDVALSQGVILIGGKAPAFSIDWKDRSDVDTDFGWPELRRELRVRTAIDGESRKSKNEQLFAYEMIVPDGHGWVSCVDMSLVPERDRGNVLEQLQGLLVNGLNGWGKAKTTASVRFKESVEEPYHIKTSAELLVITLQTPALLCNREQLNEKSCRVDLTKLYGQIWTELSEGKLELKRFFASQSLAGGRYLWKRFRGINQPYYPYLLTDAGSVFVLKAVKGDADNLVTNWLRQGLPLPNWVDEAFKRADKLGSHWSNCPYTPADGYGEIAVNLNKVHSLNTPTEVFNVI
jgi:hypothetical protein